MRSFVFAAMLILPVSAMAQPGGPGSGGSTLQDQINDLRSDVDCKKAANSHTSRAISEKNLEAAEWNNVMHAMGGFGAWTPDLLEEFRIAESMYAGANIAVNEFVNKTEWWPQAHNGQQSFKYYDVAWRAAHFNAEELLDQAQAELDAGDDAEAANTLFLAGGAYALMVALEPTWNSKAAEAIGYFNHEITWCQNMCDIKLRAGHWYELTPPGDDDGGIPE